MLALGAPWLIASGAVLLFLMLVVLRWAWGLVGEAKSLARTVSGAGERLRGAVREVNEQARIASDRAERIRSARSAGRRRARRGPPRSGV